MDCRQIGLFIAQERKTKKLTQANLAEKLHVSAKTVSKWETGNGLPDTDLLLNLCTILDITVNELLCGKRLTPETENSEARKNALKTVITKRELETLPVGNPNRTHFTGKIPVNTCETSLIVPPGTISLRFARLSS